MPSLKLSFFCYLFFSRQAAQNIANIPVVTLNQVNMVSHPVPISSTFANMKLLQVILSEASPQLTDT
jgi:hypothetical protein